MILASNFKYQVKKGKTIISKPSYSKGVFVFSTTECPLGDVTIFSYWFFAEIPLNQPLYFPGPAPDEVVFKILSPCEKANQGVCEGKRFGTPAIAWK
ncbi:hypothetical protein AVEN_195034-1 [Araneus ventricosus]|uniref:Uncharacterized protein n=1 Tax=Araneus ventricosus TaxID=182803 RepID=A0A4Y2MBC8_ARAVE|nr:hypothetical protein AVEN_195034-1 [Araneus ventricosus]